MKKAIFTIIILLFIVGCDKIIQKDENMTISVPTSLELVSTNVTDDTPLFDSEAIYEDGTFVNKDDKIHTTSGGGLVDFNNGIGLFVDDIFESGSTRYKVIKPYVDEVPNAGNTNPSLENEYQKDISGFPYNNFYTVGPTETVTFTQISGTLWSKVVSGTYGYTQQVTIHETWQPGYQDQEYFIYNGDLYRKFIIHIWPNKTRYYETTLDAMPPVLSFYSPLNQNKPFDDKNYTTAIIEGSMTYVIKGLVKFDTIALGRIIADSVQVIFKDSGGTPIGDPIIKDIDSSRDEAGNLEDWYTTDISYSDEVMEINSTVEITISGANIELGTILLGMSVDAGFTKLLLQNGYIDYSVVETNQFGNVDYIERGKVAVYDGQVDLKIINYDRIDRLMTSLGSQLIILNGSDAKNSSPNGQSIFAATQKIGRLFNFKQRTKLDGKQMHQMATYTFTLKETS